MNVFRIWMQSFLFLSFYFLNVPGLFSKLAGIQIKTETDVTEWRHGVTPMFYFQIYTLTQVLGWHIIQSSQYSTLKHWTNWNTVLPLHFINLMFIWFFSYWESFYSYEYISLYDQGRDWNLHISLPEVVPLPSMTGEGH